MDRAVVEAAARSAALTEATNGGGFTRPVVRSSATNGQRRSTLGRRSVRANRRVRPAGQRVQGAHRFQRPVSQRGPGAYGWGVNGAGGSRKPPSRQARAYWAKRGFSANGPNTVSLGRGYRRAGGSRRVRHVQRALGMRVVDGKFGTHTKRRVMQFQARHGLKVDGIVGPQTARKLHRISRRRIRRATRRVF
jgi:peptidoglycan hydrolase-like protein with peptidoglycan-binding domain